MPVRSFLFLGGQRCTWETLSRAVSGSLSSRVKRDQAGDHCEGPVTGTAYTPRRRATVQRPASAEAKPRRSL
jgi:hypothetical protein